MKTVEEFIKELENSETLKNELKAVKDKNALEDFLKKNDVDGTVEEFGKAFKVKHGCELGDDDIEKVAGGFSPWFAGKF